MRLGVSRSTAFFNGTTTTSEVETHSAAAASAAHSLDVPRPTPNGGFTHTQRSRNKISLANKGKTPWNKGVNRSEEVKAKIAEGVRRRNRQRFLDKLASMNMTEAQWEQHQADLKAQKEQERRQRLTAQGGYRLSNETRQKISRVLKERYATGQIQRKAVDPEKVRKGFTHSAETRAKIAESLKRRWATDDRYRANMLRKASTSSSHEETRLKISRSLKEKWQDPEFRESMLAKMAISKGNRTVSGGVTYDEDHRQRISEAMKAKWQDESYRAKTLEAIAKKRQAMLSQRPPRASPPPKQKKKQPTRPIPGFSSTHLNHREAALPLTSKHRIALDSRSPETPINPTSKAESASTVRSLDVSIVKPLEPKQAATARQKRRTAGTEAERSRSRSTADQYDALNDSTNTAPTRKVASPAASAAGERIGEAALTIPSTSTPSKAAKKSKKDPGDNVVEKHGSVAKLKQERRDLYDLLYGDDDEEDDDLAIRLDDAVENVKPRRSKKALHTMKSQRDDDEEGDDAQFDFHDENLDRFDPYGLDDF
jgi:NUMOD3 motif